MAVRGIPHKEKTMAKITLTPGIEESGASTDRHVIYERNGQHILRLKGKKKKYDDDIARDDLPSFMEAITLPPRKKGKKK